MTSEGVASDVASDVVSENAAVADDVVSALMAAGVGHFFVCPGSRSTPLVWALSRCGAPHTVILDERVAGFCAVGSARAGVPAAVITTSGTAVANLLPAAAEAARDDLAWVACTADRPARDVEAGANQTLDQRTLLAGAVGLDATLDLDANADGMAARAYAIVADVVGACWSQKPGRPVHVNVRFDKPLEPPAGWQVSSSWSSLPPPPSGPVCRQVDNSLIEKVKEVMAVADGGNGVVVLGGLPQSHRPGALALARALGWPIISCVSAGVSARAQGPQRLPLASLKSPALRTCLAPTVALWIGANVVDDAVGHWLSEHRPLCLQLAAGAVRRNPFDVCDAVQVVSGDELLALAEAVGSWRAALPQNPDGRGLRGAAERLSGAVDGVWAARPPAWSEPEVLRALLARVPGGAQLFVGNSMPIRDAALFAQDVVADDVLVLCNRGVSGIDGNLATALGAWRAAPATSARSTVVLGDLAALHDLSGLAAIVREGAAIDVVVVNNSGGGIFSFLPVAKLDGTVVERFFETPHTLQLAPIAAAMGMPARQATSMSELVAALDDAPPIGPRLIEVLTDRADNVEHHARLNADVAARCAEALSTWERS